MVFKLVAATDLPGRGGCGGSNSELTRRPGDRAHAVRVGPEAGVVTVTLTGTTPPGRAIGAGARARPLSHGSRPRGRLRPQVTVPATAAVAGTVTWTQSRRRTPADHDAAPGGAAGRGHYEVKSLKFLPLEVPAAVRWPGQGRAGPGPAGPVIMHMMHWHLSGSVTNTAPP